MSYNNYRNVTNSVVVFIIGSIAAKRIEAYL